MVAIAISIRTTSDERAKERLEVEWKRERVPVTGACLASVCRCRMRSCVCVLSQRVVHTKSDKASAARYESPSLRRAETLFLVVRLSLLWSMFTATKHHQKQHTEWNT